MLRYIFYVIYSGSRDIYSASLLNVSSRTVCPRLEDFEAASLDLVCMAYQMRYCPIAYGYCASNQDFELSIVGLLLGDC